MSFEPYAFGAAQINPADCLLIRANRKFCEITGYSAGELAALEYFKLVHPEEIPRNDLFVRKMIECREKAGSIETRFVRKQGGEVWVRVQSSPFRDTGGLPGPITLLVQDVSVSRKIQEKLLHSRKKIKTILESITDIFITYDSEWRYTNLNPEAEKAVGKTRRELLGKVLWDVFPELRDTEIYRRYMDSAASKEPAHFESISPVTGKWHEYHFYPLAHEYCVYMRDITKRKQAEEDLRENEEKFKAIFEGSNDAIMLLDESGFLDCNSQALKMFGHENRDSVIKTHPADISPFLQPDGRESFLVSVEHIRTALDRGYEHFEWTHMRRSGRTFLADVVLSVMTIQNRKVLQAVVRDITDLKRAEEAIQTDHHRLESMVRERTAQIAGINKSLLAEIEERKRMEKRLRSAHKKLRAMASEIVFADERSRQHFAADLHDSVVQTLAAAKMKTEILCDHINEDGIQAMNELKVMIAQSISQARLIMAELSPPVLYELGFIPALEWLTEQVETQHGIKIEFHAGKHFLPLAHEIQVLLFQSARELLMNVVKHSRAQKAVVEVTERNGAVRVRVEDNGIGLDLKNVFHTDLKSGFGLFSIRERLKHFGGQLTINSRPGEWTRVKITAPRKPGRKAG